MFHTTNFSEGVPLRQYAKETNWLFSGEVSSVLPPVRKGPVRWRVKIRQLICRSADEPCDPTLSKTHREQPAGHMYSK